MFRVFLCDDDVRFLSLLREEVEAYFQGDCDIRCFSDPGLFRDAAAAEVPDIVLLDIAIVHDGDHPAGDGIALAKRLFPSGSHTRVIFITGYAEFCSDVYETEHVWSLLKPLRSEQLTKALDKAVASLSTAPVSLIIREGKVQHAVPLDDVLFIESFYRKLTIHTTNGIYTMSGALSDLDPAVRTRFLRPHKSFLLNPRYVRSVAKDHFRLTSGDAVPISRSHRSSCQRALLSFLAHTEEVSPSP